MILEEFVMCPSNYARIIPSDELMDKNKSRKNVKVESGGNGTETSESIALPHHKSSSKKKHSKKSDGEFNGGHFSFRYLLCNNPFYPQRFRCRNRRLTGSSTTSSNDTEKTAIADEKDVPVSSAKPLGNRNDEKVNRSEDGKIRECPLCLADLPIECFPKLISCHHRSCIDCYQQYLRIEISESRVNVTCPECPESLHPNDIRLMLNDPVLIEKYEDFTLRRLLAVDPDTRWCPAPDCGYAVIASGCASCPKLRCEKPGCGSYFCYHCKAAWHPNQTCDSARAERSTNMRSSTFSRDSQTREDIKCCPICRVLIVKMDDGSCNHMTCAVCGAEFCWLCMNVVGDLHYLSPSGCTFWGKKPWSRKKKILWQLGILVGAPVGIALIAGIAVPAIIIGVPIWTGRKMYTKFLFAKRCRRNAAIVSGVITAILAAPILATLAVAIGVPILLFYVYGVVPVSLCRSSGCGVRASANGVRLDFDESEFINQTVLTGKINGGSQGMSIDADMVSQVSHKEANPSIGEVSLSLGSGTHLEHLGREQDRDSSSTIALAGSIFARRFELLSEVFAAQNANSNNNAGSETASERSDIATSSTRALHGSLLNYKTDAISTHSYKLVGNEGGSTSVEQRSEANLSLSSFEELTASLVQKVRSLKQTSDSFEDNVKPDDYVSVNLKPETVPESTPPPKPSPSKNLLRNLFFNLTSTASQSSKTSHSSASSSLTSKSSAIPQVGEKSSTSTSLPPVPGTSSHKESSEKATSRKDRSSFQKK